jgi:hypothetical protein
MVPYNDAARHVRRRDRVPAEAAAFETVVAAVRFVEAALTERDNPEIITQDVIRLRWGDYRPSCAIYADRSQNVRVLSLWADGYWPLSIPDLT